MGANCYHFGDEYWKKKISLRIEPAVLQYFGAPVYSGSFATPTFLSNFLHVKYICSPHQPRLQHHKTHITDARFEWIILSSTWGGQWKRSLKTVIPGQASNLCGGGVGVKLVHHLLSRCSLSYDGNLGPLMVRIRQWVLTTDEPQPRPLISTSTVSILAFYFSFHYRSFFICIFFHPFFLSQKLHTN